MFRYVTILSRKTDTHLQHNLYIRYDKNVTILCVIQNRHILFTTNMCLFTELIVDHPSLIVIFYVKYTWKWRERERERRGGGWEYNSIIVSTWHFFKISKKLTLIIILNMLIVQYPTQLVIYSVTALCTGEWMVVQLTQLWFYGLLYEWMTVYPYSHVWSHREGATLKRNAYNEIYSSNCFECMHMFNWWISLMTDRYYLY